MKPLEQQIIFAMLAALLGIFGCSGNMSDRQPKPTDVVRRDLTPRERAERKMLYDQLRADLRIDPSNTSQSPYWTERLEGTSAAKYQPFLDLADESGRFEDKHYYEFVFRTESEYNPNRFKEGDAWLTIVVKDEVITSVGYDVMVR